MRQSVENFLKNESFEKARGLGLAKAFSQLVKAIDNETDLDFIRKDWKVRDPKNLDGSTLNETCLRSGTQVCALGKWDKKRSALRSPVELIKGKTKHSYR